MNRRPILLDVMGTLVHDPFYKEIPEFFGLSLEEVLAQKHPDTWREFEFGTIDEEEAMRRFFRDERPVDMQGLKAAMHGAYEFLDGVEPLLTDLQAKDHELHAFSNYCPWYTLVEDKLGLSRYLEWSFVSCDLGQRKPSAAIYQQALEVLGAAPEACVFVDDRAINVEGALKVGLDAILFEGADALRAAFRQRGLL